MSFCRSMGHKFSVYRWPLLTAKNSIFDRPYIVHNDDHFCPQKILKELRYKNTDKLEKNKFS